MGTAERSLGRTSLSSENLQSIMWAKKERGVVTISAALLGKDGDNGKVLSSEAKKLL